MSRSTPAADEPSGRPRRTGRAVGVLVVLGAVVWFVVENSQRVGVRLWLVTEHPRLIWVLAVAVVVGGALGFLAGRGTRRGRAGAPGRRRSGRDVEGDGG